MKKGYVLVRLNIKDIDLFKKYPELSERSLAEHEGKYLFRGGKMNILEGKWPFERNTLIEFKSFQKAKNWYLSSTYQKALKIRMSSSSSEVILIEGY